MAVDVQKPFSALVVDHLAVRVVVDSRYENILPKETHPLATIEHVGDIPGRQMTTLAAEWGLSLHLDSLSAGTRAQYLMDFGYTPEILNRNIDLLNVDPALLNGLFLSHGHRDHYGGLDGFVLRNRKYMRDDISLYLGAEDAFHTRWFEDETAENPDGEPEMLCWGALDRVSLMAHSISAVCCETPRELDGGFTTGYIQRDSFEATTSHTMVESQDHFSEAERRGVLVEDNHPEEHALCYIVKGRGLVVISSCSHIGVINAVKTAMAVSGVDKLHAVIGGFHLAASKADYINHTVDEFEALDPDVVLPMHCTGRDFIAVIHQRMPEKLILSNLGSRFTFGV